MGLQVNSLELISEKVMLPEHDYVMRVRVLSYDAGVLKGVIVYSRDLEDITSH